MSNLHLVTGHAGKTHVTSADFGSFWAALFGNGTYVLDKGSKFAASKVSDNLVKIADGDLLMQGRHIRIPDNEYAELVITNGSAGYKRKDLIVARYTKDADSGVEEADLVVLIGEPKAADPVDPAYVTGDIIKDGALQNDVPLFRVNLNGTTITGIDSLLPETLPVIPEKIEDVAADVEQLANSTSAKMQFGSYTGTGAKILMSLTFEFVPKFVFIHAVTTNENAAMSNGGGLYEFAIDSLTTVFRNYGYTYKYGIPTKEMQARFEGNTLYWQYAASSGGTDGSLSANYKSNGRYYWYAIG